MKVAVLAALLRGAHPLTAMQRALARSMIQKSDNDVATRLWNDIGGSDGLFAFFRSVGMRHTRPAPPLLEPWDGVTTTAQDQVKLLAALFGGSGTLRPCQATFELGLMSNVVPTQRWGLTAGLPGSCTAALKNGWSPAPDRTWVVNSIGVIRCHDGGVYLAAILSQGAPSLRSGIETVEMVSQAVWRSLADETEYPSARSYPKRAAPGA